MPSRFHEASCTSWTHVVATRQGSLGGINREHLLVTHWTLWKSRSIETCQRDSFENTRLTRHLFGIVVVAKKVHFACRTETHAPDDKKHFTSEFIRRTLKISYCTWPLRRPRIVLDRVSVPHCIRDDFESNSLRIGIVHGWSASQNFNGRSKAPDLLEAPDPRSKAPDFSTAEARLLLTLGLAEDDSQKHQECDQCQCV